MARFALYSNKKKIESLEDLRTNFDIKDMLENYRSKALQRWLSMNHLAKELSQVESIAEQETDDIIDTLAIIFGISSDIINAQRQKRELAENQLRIKLIVALNAQRQKRELAENKGNSISEEQQATDTHKELNPFAGPTSVFGMPVDLNQSTNIQDDVRDMLPPFIRDIKFSTNNNVDIQKSVENQENQKSISSHDISPLNNCKIDLDSLKIEWEFIDLPKGASCVYAFDTFLIAGRDRDDNRWNPPGCSTYISIDGGFTWEKHMALSDIMGNYPLSNMHKPIKIKSKWYIFSQETGILKFDETGHVTQYPPVICGDDIDYPNCHIDMTYNGQEIIVAKGRRLTRYDTLKTRESQKQTTIYKFSDFSDMKNFQKEEHDYGCWLDICKFFKGEYFTFNRDIGLAKSLDLHKFETIIPPHRVGNGGMDCCENALFVSEHDPYARKKTRYTADGKSWKELPYRFSPICWRNNVYWAYWGNIYASSDLKNWKDIGNCYSGDFYVTSSSIISYGSGGTMAICKLPAGVSE